MLSEIVLKLGDSPTLKLNELAGRLKSEGKDIINLSAGEPSNPIPRAAEISAVEKIKTGNVKYTPASGLRELKEKVADYTRRIHSVNAKPENIIITSGAKQAIYNFLVSTINPGDEVVFPAPYWVSYPEMVKLAGGVPVPVYPPKNSLKVSITDLKKAVKEKTKVIMINSPNNPSGMVYGEEFAAELARFASARDLLVLSDDIYNRMLLDGEKCPTPFDFCGDINSSKIVSINGVSKMFSMTGFRIGWSVSSAALASAMNKIQAQTTSCPSEVGQYAAAGALEKGEDFINEMLSQLRKKRDLFMKEISGIKKAKIYRPEGAFYAFVDFSHYEKNSGKLAEKLIGETGTVTVPGAAFGMEGFLRISFCASESEITEGIRRIRKFLEGEKQ